MIIVKGSSVVIEPAGRKDPRLTLRLSPPRLSRPSAPTRACLVSGVATGEPSARGGARAASPFTTPLTHDDVRQSTPYVHLRVIARRLRYDLWLCA